MSRSTLVYKRVLLKLSGEIFAGDKRFGIDPAMLSSVASQIAEISSMSQVAIVLGGGNFFRGSKDAKALRIDRVVGDSVGMLSTLINALILQNALEEINKPTRVMSAIEVSKLAEPYIRRRAIRHLKREESYCLVVVQVILISQLIRQLFSGR